MSSDGRPPFHTHEGVEDWRILGNGLQARWRCGSFAEAVRFAVAVDALLGDEDRRPDLDLREDAVTVHLRERLAERIWYDDADLAVVRRIQTAARGLGLAPDPGSLRSIQLAVAHARGVDVRPFWEAVLDYRPINDEDVMDPQDRGPRVWFHELENGRTGRGRTHVDVYLPADQADAVLAAATAAGGRIADDSHAPDWWTLASPDNHGVDIAPWPDRE